MKRAKDLSDETMRALLSDYERPELPRERFEAWMDRARPATLPFRPRGRLGPMLAWTAAAAALAAIVTGGGIFLKGNASLDAPLAVYRQGSDGTESVSDFASPFELSTGAGEEARFETPGERVAVGAGSLLSIRQEALRALSGDAGFSYRLERGSMYLVHDGREGFAIRTAFGTIVPAGTALSLKIENGSMELACLEGALFFAPRSGGRRIRVVAGMRISRTEKESSSTDLGIPRPFAGPRDLPFIPRLPGPAQVPIDVPREGIEEASAIGAKAAAIEAPLSTEPGLKRSPGPGLDPSSAPASPRASNGPTFIPLWEKASGVNGPYGLEAGADSLVVLDGTGLKVREAASGSPRYEVKLDKRPDAFALGSDIYLLSGTELRCLALSDGSVRWKAQAGLSSFAGIACSGGLVAVASADGKLYLFDADSGAPRGTLRDEAGLGMYGTALITGNLAIVSSLDKSLAALRLDGSGRAWALKAEGRFSGDRPFLLRNGSLVVDGDSAGNWYAAATASGEAAWRAAFSPPLKRWPIPCGEGALYEDALGLRSLDAQGRVLGIKGVAGSLLAAASAGNGAIAISGEGAWSLDPAGADGTPRRLAAGKFALASIAGGRAYAMDASGAIKAWGIAE